jgi:protein-S-isoprenylcysteine O-methyltransferase Ste14
VSVESGERSTIQRIRVPLGFLMAALYLWLAPKVATRLGIAVGVGFVALGLLVRAWAAGYIVKNEQLAVRGPYAHTRNPLYFGSFLLAIGFAVAAHWSFIPLVFAFWLVVYYPTIEREAAFLRSKYLDAFMLYERNVPSFFPRVTPWAGPDDADSDPGFSVAKYMRHNEWQAGLGATVVLLWLVWRSGILTASA